MLKTHLVCSTVMFTCASIVVCSGRLQPRDLIRSLVIKTVPTGGGGGGRALSAEPVERQVDLRCPSCDRVHCSPRRPSELTTCRGGVVRGICNCCPVCAKTEGQDCGGQWHYRGRCDTGLVCRPDAAATSHESEQGELVASPWIQDPTRRNTWETEGKCRRSESIISLWCSVPSVSFRVY